MKKTSQFLPVRVSNRFINSSNIAECRISVRLDGATVFLTNGYKLHFVGHEAQILIRYLCEQGIEPFWSEEGGMR
jgi:hypothetical protein